MKASWIGKLRFRSCSSINVKCQMTFEGVNYDQKEKKKKKRILQQIPLEEKGNTLSIQEKKIDF